MGWVPWDPKPFALLGCTAVWEPSITARTCCGSHTRPQQRGYKSFLNTKAHMGTQKWNQQSLELPAT